MEGIQGSDRRSDKEAQPPDVFGSARSLTDPLKPELSVSTSIMQPSKKCQGFCFSSEMDTYLFGSLASVTLVGILAIVRGHGDRHSLYPATHPYH